MKQFYLIFIICVAFIFAGCQVVDKAAGLFVKQKETPRYGMTSDQYAAWYNEHAKTNPGLVVPPKLQTSPEPSVVPTTPEPEAVTLSDFESTSLAKTAEGAASVVPVPYLREGVEAAVYLSTLWTAWRINRKQKQAALDAKQKGDDDLKLRDKLMIATSVGVELATTDGTIKKKIKGLMTKKQQDLFDDITEGARVAAKAAKEIASN